MNLEKKWKSSGKKTKASKRSCKNSGLSSTASRHPGNAREIPPRPKECAEGLRTEKERRKAHSQFVKKLKDLAKGDYQHFEVRRLAKRALKYRHEMFTFLLVLGVEPTNNAAERALRPCVRQRKISGCHRTLEGAENRDILMSVMGTMTLQGGDFLEAGREYMLSARA